MANATVSMETKSVTVEVEEKVVQLTLSEREAKVLRALVGMVAGSSSVSYRKETAAIRSALINSGIDVYTGDYFTGTVTARISS